MNHRPGMVGMTEFFGFLALVGLPCFFALIARSHGRPMWSGLVMGMIALVLLISGHLLVLMAIDWENSKKYPHREGLSLRASVIILLTFVLSAAAAAAMVWWLRG